MKEFRVHNLGQDFQTHDEARTGPAEVRRTVDAEDARARDPCQRLGLSGGALRVPAAWHRDDDLWSCGHDLVVRDFPRTLASTPKDVGSARDRDLLRHPVPAIEERIQPLEARDARPFRFRNGLLDRRDAPAECGDELVSLARPAQRVAEAPHIAEHPFERRCVECDHDWNNGHKFRTDLWAGGDKNSLKNPEKSALLNCEYSLTRHTQIIVNPPSNLPVDKTPIFNAKTRACFHA